MRRSTTASSPQWSLSTRLFFFFQAEDGIRDLTVTGVQTCALPIFAGDELLHRGEGDRVPVLGRPPPDGGADLFPGDPDANGSQAGRDQNQPGEARSEERRVGKEGRSRWSPDH